MSQLYRNPNEIACVVRTKTFYINSFLNTFDPNEGFPLQLYNLGNISRYEFIVIDENKKAATANIPLMEIMRINRMTDYLYTKHQDALREKKTTKLSPAYTVQMMGGGDNMKGKTAAQYLLDAEDKGAARESLRKQYDFLRANVQRYPRNAEQMNAISDAFRLSDLGELSPSKGITAGTTEVLYEASMRPLASKKGKVPERLLRQNPNYEFVYGIKIEWILGSDNPIQITISNYFAPVVKKESGMLNVLSKEADKETFIHNTMNLSADEWANMVYLIQMDMRRFEMIHAQQSYKTAMEWSAKNREVFAASRS